MLNVYEELQLGECNENFMRCTEEVWRIELKGEESIRVVIGNSSLNNLINKTN